MRKTKPRGAHCLSCGTRYKGPRFSGELANGVCLQCGRDDQWACKVCDKAPGEYPDVCFACSQAARQSNPVLDGVKVPSWVSTIARSLRPGVEAFLESVVGPGARLGRAYGCGHYGCGHYGCVFEIPGSPWVVKLTRDPTEGPIWQGIQALWQQDPYAMQGMVRVLAVAQAARGVRWRGKEQPLYLIVREDVHPLAGNNYYGFGMSVSDATIRRIEGQPGGSSGAAYFAGSLKKTMRDLSAFKTFAGDYYNAQSPRSKTHREFEMIREQLDGIAEGSMQSEPVGHLIGATLSHLMDKGLVLRDVHLGNVGWRVHEKIPGFPNASAQGLVIYDPGHTPTEGRGPIRRVTL